MNKLLNLVGSRLVEYGRLIRLDKPIGIWLLLWPTLWALWIAGNGHPREDILWIFIAGVVVMRSAGCAVNDYADRNIDPHVTRTRDRPLAAKRIRGREAIAVYLLLSLTALALIWPLNWLTRYYAIAGAGLALAYPFMKRITSLPQAWLGMAFSWSIPMAFAALTNSVPEVAWWLFACALLWTVVYDTMYAMADRADDLRAGVRSTATLFGDWDRWILGILQLLIIMGLLEVGASLNFGWRYQTGLLAGAGCFVWQQILIRRRSAPDCFKAFVQSHYFGLCVFLGLVMEYFYGRS